MYELNILLKEGAKPFYEQIYEFIVNEIRSGALPPMTKMPSTRGLAANLGVSRSTTQFAYDQLVSEGYFEAVPCKGYFVADMEWMSGVLKEAKESTKASVREEVVSDDTEWFCDFSPRGIDIGSFPARTWRTLSKDVLNAAEAGETLFNAGASQGEWELREALASYLRSARGVRCNAEQIIVGAGNEYLLLLLSRFLGEEKRIAMENPTYRQAGRVFGSVDYEVVPVKMDAFGMSVTELEKSKVKLAYVMPSHQYPTGIIMPIKRRMEMLAWAEQEEERYLIEDDYDSEFRYRGKPIPALFGVGQSEKVIYLGTFSRSIAPAIRISYMVLPKKLLRKYQETCHFYASTVSRVDQQLLARFIQEGHFERHLNKMRKIYREKHDVLLEELEPLKDTMRITGDSAGIHLLLTAKDKTREKQLVEQARSCKVKVYPMSHNYIEGDLTESHTIILGYANCTLGEIREGARALVKLWAKK